MIANSRQHGVHLQLRTGPSSLGFTDLGLHLSAWGGSLPHFCQVHSAGRGDVDARSVSNLWNWKAHLFSMTCQR
ncbi:MAG: hypothetical protein ACJAZO_001215 [Myxococcota bacterium]|jgi:hypothetical protein